MRYSVKKSECEDGNQFNDMERERNNQGEKLPILKEAGALGMTILGSDTNAWHRYLDTLSAGYQPVPRLYVYEGNHSAPSSLTCYKP
jgi:hypothetical protein